MLKEGVLARFSLGEQMRELIWLSSLSILFLSACATSPHAQDRELTFFELYENREKLHGTVVKFRGRLGLGRHFHYNRSLRMTDLSEHPIASWAYQDRYSDAKKKRMANVSMEKHLEKYGPAEEFMPYLDLAPMNFLYGNMTVPEIYPQEEAMVRSLAEFESDCVLITGVLLKRSMDRGQQGRRYIGVVVPATMERCEE